ncbi:MAG: hypothetical protein AAGH89_04995 [Verrucomicrobiota bacterium]
MLLLIAAILLEAPQSWAEKGMWGELKMESIFLRPPDPLLEVVQVPSEQTEWKFFDLSTQQVVEVFERANLTPQQLNLLVDVTRWHIEGNRIRIFPQADVVTSLSPISRSTIYRVLAKWSENTHHQHPVILGAEDPNVWFSGTKIDPNLVRNLSYRRGDTALFSDVPKLLQSLNHADEQLRLMKTLLRSRSLMAHVLFDPESDFESFLNYWSVGGTQTHAVPLLKSLQRAQIPRSIDVSHFLPELPRKQLNTYPSISDGLAGRYPDGMWTAINFFKHDPIDIYSDQREADAYVREHFQPIQAPYRFGDLIFLVHQTRRDVIHSCIFVAGNVVFTKNNAGILYPWVLSKLDDVKLFHQREEPLFVSAWRRKEVVQAMAAAP